MWKSSCGNTHGELLSSGWLSAAASSSSFSSSPSPLFMSAFHPLSAGAFYCGSPMVMHTAAAAAPYTYGDVHTGVDVLNWAKNAWHGFKEPKTAAEADVAISALQSDIASFDKLKLNSQLCQAGVAQLKAHAVKHVQLYKDWKATSAFQQEKKLNKEEYNASKKGFSGPGPVKKK
jgi:hypothetical protein